MEQVCPMYLCTCIGLEHNTSLFSIFAEDVMDTFADSGSNQKKGSKPRREKNSVGAAEPAVTVGEVAAKGEPNASACQARGAGRRRPNKRIPANADDLDKALSKRAKQLFSGISM